MNKNSTIGGKSHKQEPEEIYGSRFRKIRTGGTAVGCSCAMGGGTKWDNDKACACVVVGFGNSRDGEERCFCALAGFGYDY